MRPSLRSHIADVLAKATRAWDDPLDPDAAAYDGVVVADALLADPTLAAIIDLAAWFGQGGPYPEPSAEVRALLADWRAER